MMEMNQEIKAVLTKRGAALLWGSYLKLPAAKRPEDPKEGDTWTGPFWEAMSIFGGDNMGHGDEHVFKDGKFDVVNREELMKCERVRANGANVECPHCSCELGGWMVDPRGAGLEEGRPPVDCESCGKSFVVPYDVRVVLY